MTPQVRVLPAADRDIDGQADYLMHEASLETALRFYDADSRHLREPCPNARHGRAAGIHQPSP